MRNKTSKSKNKPTFYEFVKRIYGLTYSEYEELSDMQKDAAELDYKNRYGHIKWF